MATKKPAAKKPAAKKPAAKTAPKEKEKKVSENIEEQIVEEKPTEVTETVAPIEESSKNVQAIDEFAPQVLKNEDIRNFKQQLQDLRKEGVSLRKSLREENLSIRRNKIMDAQEKRAKISENNERIKTARQNEKDHKVEIKELIKKSVVLTKTVGKKDEKESKIKCKQNLVALKQNHENNLVKINEEHNKLVSDFKNEVKTNKNLDKSEVSIRQKELNMMYKASLHDENTKYQENVRRERDELFSTYMARRNTVIDLKGGKQNIWEKIEFSRKSYANQFKLSKFLLDNALYITILLVYIACIIIAPVSGKGNLLTFRNIFKILEQSSTRVFYALGVAGLILLAGTDLSIGRMIALGSVTTAVILHNGPNIVTFFGLPAWDFSSIPMVGRVFIALGASVILCTFFSAIAGFFTAKFKMHPFITTLSTQLLIYGLLYFSTQGTPTGGVSDEIRDIIGGGWYIGNAYFSKLILYAIVVIAIVWFIWNKTKFGKNMYAVGGNSEAASVSGISVFAVTLGVFIMAGILYGCGSFLESFGSNSSAGTGQGWELDAIAACVVGGISFNGGIGKIRGAVLGVIIFTGLTYCLSFLGVDTNLQFIFKGIIIMAACALDSVKYLKKK